jgi:hypothetical protein
MIDYSGRVSLIILQFASVLSKTKNSISYCTHLSHFWNSFPDIKLASSPAQYLAFLRAFVNSLPSQERQHI